MIQKFNFSVTLLVLFLLITGCEKISSLLGSNKEDDSQYLSIKGMYDVYNKKDLSAYCDFFSEDVNVFKEQGLGNTRIITGKREFQIYYEQVFRAKKFLKVTPLQHFSVYPWVMVKELIESEDQVFQAAVGYRIQGGKIRDRMILSENFLVNKGSVSIDLPKEKKSSELPLPAPTLQGAPGAPVKTK
jgi:hypothetical protein